MELRKSLIEQARKMSNVRVDKPFEQFPNYEVLRHKKNDKWFGLFMTVEKNKLGLSGEEYVDILDVKADPEFVSILRNTPGYFPAYHMDKNHWITVLLDGTIDERKILDLIKDSYNLTI
ncbi:MmcQ/YjbR family DNA-binding protein [Enterococcus massiliensis]|uniref:MmcQ/YjbR family DNA-binding protein n=1 Tax=Enterococcus massiliensis TaxID=1640685 RepID=UPI00065E9707|nr:MmcQ/YjbR family DNA-binding protein [Enterococcus massiliensis]